MKLEFVDFVEFELDFVKKRILKESLSRIKPNIIEIKIEFFN